METPKETTRPEPSYRIEPYDVNHVEVIATIGEKTVTNIIPIGSLNLPVVQYDLPEDVTIERPPVTPAGKYSFGQFARNALSRLRR